MGRQGFDATYICGREATTWIGQEWERLSARLEARNEYADVYVEIGTLGVVFSAGNDSWGDVDMVAQLITSAQRKFPGLPPFYMEYSRWPDFSSSGPFGGGALVCANGEARRIDTREWLTAQGAPKEG